jgi:hypothetical protein
MSIKTHVPKQNSNDGACDLTHTNRVSNKRLFVVRQSETNVPKQCVNDD